MLRRLLELVGLLASFPPRGRRKHTLHRGGTAILTCWGSTSESTQAHSPGAESRQVAPLPWLAPAAPTALVGRSRPERGPHACGETVVLWGVLCFASGWGCHASGQVLTSRKRNVDMMFAMLIDVAANDEVPLRTADCDRTCPAAGSLPHKNLLAG